MRVLRTVLPVIALVAMVAGCSSSEDENGQLTAQQENYCSQLAAWQRARNAADTETPDPSGYDYVGDVAQDVLLAARPLRDESVGAGRTLAEATAATMKQNDSLAEGHVVQYCADAGFGPMMR